MQHMCHSSQSPGCSRPALTHTHAHRCLAKNQAQQEAAVRPSAARGEQCSSAEPHDAHAKPAQTAGAASCTLRQQPHTPSLPGASAEPHDASSLRVDVNVKEARPRGQARHGHHVANQGVQEASTHRCTHVTDRQRETARRACTGQAAANRRYTARREGVGRLFRRGTLAPGVSIQQCQRCAHRMFWGEAGRKGTLGRAQGLCALSNSGATRL